MPNNGLLGSGVSTNLSRTADELSMRGANNLIHVLSNGPTDSYSQSLAKVSDAFSGMNNGNKIQNSWAQFVNNGDYSNNAYANWANNNVFNNGNNNNYNQTFSNWLNLGQLGVNLLSGLGSFFNGRSYLNLAKNQLAQQQNQFNETYNNALKKENAADSALISNRALYKTGDSHAYDDEIAANAYSRGHTGTDSSEDSYLGYKRSANA